MNKKVFISMKMNKKVFTAIKMNREIVQWVECLL